MCKRVMMSPIGLRTILQSLSLACWFSGTRSDQLTNCDSYLIAFVTVLSDSLQGSQALKDTLFIICVTLNGNITKRISWWIEKITETSNWDHKPVRKLFPFCSRGCRPLLTNRKKSIQKQRTVFLWPWLKYFLLWFSLADGGRHKHQCETREAIVGSGSHVWSPGEGPGQCWSVEPLESCGDLAD